MLLLVPGVYNAQLSSCPRYTQDKLTAYPQSCERLMLGATFAAPDLICKSHGLRLATGDHESLKMPAFIHSRQEVRSQYRVVSCKECCKHIVCCCPFTRSSPLSQIPVGCWESRMALPRLPNSPQTGAHIYVRGSHIIIASIGLWPSWLLLMQGKSIGRWRQEHSLTRSHFVSCDLMLTALCLKSYFSFNQKE